MKVLAVDNDYDTGITLKALLADNPEIEIEIALDAKSAEQLLAVNNDYDAVIVDIMMPEISGLDLAKTISRNEKLRRIPIILMSSALPLPPAELLDTMKNDGEMGSVKGAIEKPFVVENLLEVLRDVTAHK